jgi:pilus assembly protein Flp/PilA
METPMQPTKPHDRSIRRFIRDEEAATAIEYAMIAGGIAVAIVAAVNSLGLSVLGLFQSVQAGWPG